MQNYQKGRHKFVLFFRLPNKTQKINATVLKTSFSINQNIAQETPTLNVILLPGVLITRCIIQ